MNSLKDYIKNRRILLVVFLCIMAVYGLSFYKRLSSYWYWMEHSQEYVVEDVIAMSSMDAYYWLRMARELDKGNIGKGMADPTKGYPDLDRLAIKDRSSLLAEFISLGKNFTGGDYYRSGLLLIPVLAGLFVFPLFFYFNRLGYGTSAVLGGLVGNFGHAYYDRTMMGRLDTDLLNTFFPIAAASFILPISRERSLAANLGLAAGTGLTLHLFTRWYQQPSFILVYGFFLLLHLFFQRVRIRQIALFMTVFLLMSGPEYVMQTVGSFGTFFRAYVSPPPTGQIAWPHVLKSVAEAKNYGIMTSLRSLHGFLPIVFVGFAGLAYLCIRHFRQMIPMIPLILIGAWSLVGPSRFAMYWAPLVGVGAGVVVEMLARFCGGKLKLQPLTASVASLPIMFVLFFSTAAYTGFHSHPAPMIGASTTRALLDIKRSVPKHSAMFTPYWSYGYALMEIGEFATYHDGGLQGGIRTTLAAKAATSSRQGEMVSLLSYLEDNGFNPLIREIRQGGLSADEMMKRVFSYPKGFRGENVHLLYLEDMIWKVDSMTYFGTWDFAKKTSDSLYYFELHCFSMADNIMTCHDGTIDLSRGVMNDGAADIPLRAVLWINNGYVVEERSYPNMGGYYLQILMKDEKIKNIVVADERLYRTNFNQQFLLGNYDRRHFEEVYNNYPLARVLKIKAAQDSARALPSSEAGATTGRLAGE